MVLNQHLQSLTYCNSELGVKSLAKLEELMPQMIDLRLVRVKVSSTSLYHTLFDGLIDNAKYL